MSLIPLPNDAAALSRVLGELREEIRRSQPRRLGRSTISDGTLEVKAGGAIRIHSGARLIVDDGGQLVTDAAAVTGANLATEHDVYTGENLDAAIGADWTTLVSVKITPPAWAGAAVLTVTGGLSARAMMGAGGDIRARFSIDSKPGPDSYAYWAGMGQAACWSGTLIRRVSLTPEEPLVVTVEAVTASPATLDGKTPAHMAVHVVWQA